MQIRTNQLKKYNYIIIGAGIIGLTILRELLEKGKKDILVIESGSMLSTNPYPDFMKVISKNHKKKPLVLSAELVVVVMSGVQYVVCLIKKKLIVIIMKKNSL